MNWRRQFWVALATSLILVGHGAWAADKTSTVQQDLREAYYARAASLFRNPPLVSESLIYEDGGELDGARLTILRDFRIQTQIEIHRFRSGKDISAELEARFTSSPFPPEPRKMKDASNLESATVDTYWIAISEDEFTSIMEKLRKLATIPAESPPRDDGMYCLHEAGAYFESVEAGERVFFARRGCDADFGDVVLQAAPLVDLATKRLPSAAKKFDFVISLFEDMAEKKKKSDE